MGKNAAIRDRIRDLSLVAAGGKSATDVRIGLKYTAVGLDNGRAGVAYTFYRDLRAGCNVWEEIHPLAGRSVSDLVSMFESSDVVNSAIALAASNALSNKMGREHVEGNMLDHLDLRPEDAVGMVGHFAPLVPFLRERVSSLMIFEKTKEPTGELLPEKEAYDELPRCDVALISSTSILNNTIEGLLEVCRSCREVVMLGASTPLIPEAFENTPVTCLSGVVIEESREIMRIVSEGGGMRRFKGYVRKVNLRLQ
jgi:uncharacterized protein (DUF4213/DUF364 family)